MLRFRSLEVLLEKYQWRRVSLEGLKSDYPDAFNILRNAYLDVEAYEMMKTLEYERTKADSEFAFYYQQSTKRAGLISHQSSYDEFEYKIISESFRIPIADIQEIIETTR